MIISKDVTETPIKRHRVKWSLHTFHSLAHFAFTYAVFFDDGIVRKDGQK